jgi:hypothetical protein
MENIIEEIEVEEIENLNSAMEVSCFCRAPEPKY